MIGMLQMILRDCGNDNRDWSKGMDMLQEQSETAGLLQMMVMDGWLAVKDWLKVP